MNRFNITMALVVLVMDVPLVAMTVMYAVSR
jgi:hypothetical protein